MVFFLTSKGFQSILTNYGSTFQNLHWDIFFAWCTEMSVVILLWTVVVTDTSVAISSFLGSLLTMAIIIYGIKSWKNTGKNERLPKIQRNVLHCFVLRERMNKFVICNLVFKKFDSRD